TASHGAVQKDGIFSTKQNRRPGDGGSDCRCGASHPLSCLRSVPSSSQRPDLHPRLPALSLRESDGAFRTDCRNSSRRARKPTSHAGCLVRQIPLTAVFQKLLCNQPGILAQCLLHLAGELGVVAEE